MKVYGLLRAAVLVSTALTARVVVADPDLCEVHDSEIIDSAPVVVPTQPLTPMLVPAAPEPAAPPAPVLAPDPVPGPIPAAVPAPVVISTPLPLATQGPAPTPSQPQPASTPAPAPVPNSGSTQTTPGQIKAVNPYKGGNGGGPGSYDMVTDLATCSKQSHPTTSSVSPFDDDVSVSFRGPMTIHNIAVFDGRQGTWQKVSSFTKGGATENMVFMNNNNIDFNGKSSPQGYATSDGKGVASQPQTFLGELQAATNPTSGFLASEKTGSEVNIFTNAKCGQGGVQCTGYYDKDGTAHKGWEGGKKIVITKVQMPHGSAPNLPAIWMLNGQVVRANQYGCNCRGISKVGGCGELDIAEVIEKDVNVVATHYYFYNGNPSPGHDSWSKRPINSPTTYITIIDESYGVKVVEVDDFNFQSTSISSDVVSKGLSA